MSQLLESIYLNDGVFRNLSYHEERMKKSMRDIFKREMTIELSTLLSGMKFPSTGLYKTRIIYDTKIRKIEFVPYILTPVRSLKLIHSDSISYKHKFLDRSSLHSLYDQRGKADDVLMVKNGFITDTYYANIIFKKNSLWYTPKHYLLNGTMRQYLLEKGMIMEAVIDEKNYTLYQSCKLINSMLAMDGEEISIELVI
jgi:4-amino-4-deoxychorismate lyase